jgi:hypothetical protein
MTGQCRVLAIIGSGETSPTMVEVHKNLVARLDTARPEAVLLDTPYAFQENAAEVSARAQAYFARSVGLTVRAAGGPGEAAAVRDSDWVFAGPGSPSYALARWQGSPVAEALRDRIGAGTGITVLASAAAATAGLATVPVYEIYKAGAEPHWLDGLDLLGVLGLDVALIPHYNNTEGGSHDTRYCYLGERRLSAMERKLPAVAAVLGVDEHTAAVFDLAAGTVEVTGRGSLTVRRSGSSAALPAGTVLPLDDLRSLVRTGAAEHGPARPAPAVAAEPASAGPPPLHEVTAEARRRFDAAVAAGDADGMVGAILDLEAAIQAWSADTEEDQGTEQARAVLRGLITRLGKAARDGLADPWERLRPAVDALVCLRAEFRRGRRFGAADAIRDALAAADVRLEDAGDQTRWAAPGR